MKRLYIVERRIVAELKKLESERTEKEREKWWRGVARRKCRTACLQSKELVTKERKKSEIV